MRAQIRFRCSSHRKITSMGGVSETASVARQLTVSFLPLSVVDSHERGLDFRWHSPQGCFDTPSHIHDRVFIHHVCFSLSLSLSIHVKHDEGGKRNYILNTICVIYTSSNH